MSSQCPGAETQIAHSRRRVGFRKLLFTRRTTSFHRRPVKLEVPQEAISSGREAIDVAGLQPSNKSYGFVLSAMFLVTMAFIHRPCDDNTLTHYSDENTTECD
ncbi:hypothetical protein EVAR_30684_1 [Eumeta japonica]|uniref:Uncharacterized protein n=1 Tax=Eumeta variegata TaxID=151549 RepID=A0A4C1VQ53_EUMVA|nr:hypothetical protein EVAR_30684_1 [Eumeta japonica]